MRKLYRCHQPTRISVSLWIIVENVTYFPWSLPFLFWCYKNNQDSQRTSFQTLNGVFYYVSPRQMMHTKRYKTWDHEDQWHNTPEEKIHPWLWVYTKDTKYPWTNNTRLKETKTKFLPRKCDGHMRHQNGTTGEPMDNDLRTDMKSREQIMTSRE